MGSSPGSGFEERLTALYHKLFCGTKLLQRTRNFMHSLEPPMRFSTKLAYDHVQWWALILAVWKFRVLLQIFRFRFSE